MDINKSVAFIDYLIKETKKNAISWNPLKYQLRDESFPRLDCDHAHYCKVDSHFIAIGGLLPQYVESTDVGLFVCINNSKTFFLLENTDLSDGQDFDLLCSKTFRLDELVNAPDNSLETFIDDLLTKENL